MDYRYNYKFLAQWMKHNNINRKNVLDAVGTRDFDSINAWKDGNRALPVGMLLRICNTFQIPLEAFFIDYDQSPAVAVPYPTADDQTEPNGGFPNDKERKNRQGLNPKAKFIRKTELPHELLVADNVKPVSIIPTNKDDNPNLAKDNAHDDTNNAANSTNDADSSKESEAPTTNNAAPTANESESNNKPTEGESRCVSCNSVAAPTTSPIPTTENNPDNPPLLKDSIEILELKIKHQQELMNTQKQSRDHEDAMRSEFIHRGDKLREKLYAIIDKQQSTIDRQQQTISHQQDTITRLTSHNNNSYSDLDGLAAEQLPQQKNNVG